MKDAPSDLSRLRWQCRRGMRELDILLERYLLQQYAAASEQEKAAFRALLELSDPQLAGYLLRDEPASEAIEARVIGAILSQHPD